MPAPSLPGRSAARVIQGGWLDGNRIRRARKDYRCDYWRGLQNGGMCKTRIKAGDLYAEGERNDTAGGYGVDRYCLACAGEEARQAAKVSEPSLPEPSDDVWASLQEIARMEDVALPNIGEVK